MRFPAWAAALLVSACAFSSETPLFSSSETAQPVNENTIYDFDDGSGQIYELRFDRSRAAGYLVIERADPSDRMEVVFVAIAETPEDDYIVQTVLESGEATRAYAFMWREGEGYRMITDPGHIEPGGKPLMRADAYCARRSFDECRLASREAIMSLYRELIYPRFVAGDEIPGAYTTLTPHADAAHARAAK